MNFSFAGCGFLGIYHVGVASCLKQHVPELIRDCQFAGASAGAIIACCLISDCCLGDCTSFALRLATKARSRSLGPLHPSFNIQKILRDALREVLPSNAHEIASGKLHISFTRVSDRKNVVVSDYESKEELIQALLCSAHVPLYSGLVPPSFRGVRYIDGGLSDNIPAINDETISVSPFAGESDICPSDNSSNPLHILLANTSMQCSMGNLYRMSRALFPPHPEVLSDMCRQGFDDCLKFLQKNNLISCTRHLSVKSTVTPVRLLSESESETDDMTDGLEEDEHGADCRECKKKVQTALVDNLPPVVVSALQSACDSVNKGMSAYIQRHRSLRYLSLLATPWVLPVDFVYNFSLRFLEYLPMLPRDVQSAYREMASFLRVLIAHVRHRRRRYTARFTCQLAITEVKFDQPENISNAMEVLSGPFQPQPAQSSVRNLNIGFAVDFETELQNTVKSLHQIEGKLDQFDINQIELHSSEHGHELLFHPDPHHMSCGDSEQCSQLFDTFEQCLQVSNEMDSTMAYYYQDEGNKQCYNFREIFDLDHVNIDIPKVDAEKVDSEAESTADLSWDNLMAVQPDIENDLEQFIESKSHVIHTNEVDS